MRTMVKQLRTPLSLMLRSCCTHSKEESAPIPEGSGSITSTTAQEFLQMQTESSVSARYYIPRPDRATSLRHFTAFVNTIAKSSHAEARRANSPAGANAEPILLASISAANSLPWSGFLTTGYLRRSTARTFVVKAAVNSLGRPLRRALIELPDDARLHRPRLVGVDRDRHPRLVTRREGPDDVRADHSERRPVRAQGQRRHPSPGSPGDASPTQTDRSPGLARRRRRRKPW